ncbi:MAG: hypothetical protein JWN13_1572 [Betaproteobacteria bacterium]|jgi:hypothetical protein|nr:hypothetical protein [Betaproteobacteria bacterium]
MKLNRFLVIIALAFTSMVTGCASVAVTVLGMGAGAAVNHTLTGITYKTFTAPVSKVKIASIGALNRMGIKPSGSKKQEGNQIVKATAKDRDIEIVLEPISSNSTRMRVIARNGRVLYDSATATEIIMQTERILAKS